MILLFGFSGNPPHRCHLDVISQAIASTDKIITCIVIVPCRKHPFGKKLNNFETISRLASAFAKDVNAELGIRTSMEDLEGAYLSLPRSGEVAYTANVVEMLKITKNTSDGILLCYGPDNKENFKNFKYREFLEENTTLFFAEEKEKCRSTLIREAISSGHFPDELLTPNVKQVVLDLPAGSFNMSKKL